MHGRQSVLQGDVSNREGRDGKLLLQGKVWLLIACTALCLLTAPAQQPRAYMEAIPGNGMIKIRWLTSELPQGGYVLERRPAGTGEYQPLPNMPLQPNWASDVWQQTFGVFFAQALLTVGVERTNDFFERLRTQPSSRIALGL
ncbi:MAG: hypothetical protein NZ741_12575, partial [Armatimonadetes bacterium]|nr:hypothetical protein [Armatimonadota bacterium]